MGINKHERFENHLDVSSPETQGDAEKIETFSEDAYDDLFDKRLSYLETLANKIPNKSDVASDIDNNAAEDYEDKRRTTSSKTQNILPTHLSSLLLQKNFERCHGDAFLSEDNEEKKSVYTDDKKHEIISIEGTLDTLPESRQDAVYNSFENAPNEIKRLVTILSDKLSVEQTVDDDDSHYDLLDEKIRMEENLDDSEYVEVFSHEYGHFVDNQLGDVSAMTDFREATEKDLKQYDRSTEGGIERFNAMMDDLMNSDAAFDMAVSDNISAYFKNDPEIIKRYSDEGIAYYGHDNDYWSISGTREAEIYANSFSMSAQNNESSCEFMKKYFPHTWEQFNQSLRGGVK